MTWEPFLILSLLAIYLLVPVAHRRFDAWRNRTLWEAVQDDLDQLERSKAERAALGRCVNRHPAKGGR